MSKLANVAKQDTRELLIKKSTSLFAQKGYGGTTIKDICDATGMNASLVSYYFGGKEGLFHACLENFGEERLEIAEKMLIHPRSRQEFEIRLGLFAEELINVHIEQSDLATLIHREFENQNPASMEIFKKTFFKAFEVFISFFESAQKQKIIRQDINPRIAGAILMGCVKSYLMYKKVKKGFLGFGVEDVSSRKKIKEHLIKIFCEGLFYEK